MRALLSVAPLTLVLATALAGLGARAAEFHVDSYADTVDANPFDLVCADALGRCTLRAAVIQANVRRGEDHIFVPRQQTPPSQLPIARAGADEDASLTGDLDITDDLVIQLAPPKKGEVQKGVDPPPQVVDGNGLDRVFDVHPGATVVLGGLLIRNGAPPPGGNGGAIRNRGDLRLGKVVLQDNQANLGGAVFSDAGATLQILASEISHNQAHSGGGIWSNFETSLQIQTTQLFENHASGATDSTGGAIVTLGFGEIARSTLRDNDASVRGGAIANAGNLTLIETTVHGNQTPVVNPPVGPLAGSILLNTGEFAIFNSSIVDNKTSTTAILNVTHTGDPAILTLFQSTVHDNTLGGLGVLGEGAAAYLGNSVVGPNLFGGCLLGEEGEAGYFSLGGNVTVEAVGLGGNPNNCPFDPPEVLPTGTPLHLGPLDDNGGPTETRAPEPGSPAIDAADAVLCLPTDQRGVPRPQGAGCDAGAVERTNVMLSLEIIKHVLELVLMDRGFGDGIEARLDQAERLLADANPENDRAGLVALEGFARLVEALPDRAIPEADAEFVANLARVAARDYRLADSPRRR